MRMFKVILPIFVLATISSAQLPKGGTVIISTGGTVGIPLGGIVKEENAYGEKIDLNVRDTANGNIIETNTVDYKHFSWTGEAGLDIYFGSKFGIGINGGYYAVQQKLVAQENVIKKQVEQLEGLVDIKGGVVFALPVYDNSFVSFKLFGGYSKGKLNRVPTMAASTISTTSFKSYILEQNKKVDISGPSGSFEVAYNVFRVYGLMGNIGIRYGAKFLKGTKPIESTGNIPNYVGDDTWLDQSISVVLNVGFGINTAKRISSY